MKNIFIALVLAACSSPLYAAQTDRVAAVVNDQIITQSQLEARCTLEARAQNLTELTAVQRRSLCRRTLAGLIDQELQRQYAVRVRLEVQPTELIGARQQLEKQGALGPGGWAGFSRGLETAAKDKLTADLRWQKIVETTIRPGINVATTEVDQLIADMARKRQVTEREISQIMVAADDAEGPEAVEKAKEKIDTIATKLKAGGNFAELARAFSDDKTGLNGGRMGWFASGELNPQLEDALDKLTVGTISAPIRTPLGWHLVRLDNQRETKPIDTQPVTERQFFLIAASTPSDTDAAKALEANLKTATAKLDNPVAVAGYVADSATLKQFPASAALGWLPVTDLQAGLQPVATATKDGAFSLPTRFAGNTGVLYVAGTRTTMPKQLETYRERVRQHLGQSRTELASRKLMRELRQRAFVDMRF
jgi:peptidyl-prolyl cis-trans isomerase SurA